MNAIATVHTKGMVDNQWMKLDGTPPKLTIHLRHSCMDLTGAETGGSSGGSRGRHERRAPPPPPRYMETHSQ